MHGIGDPNAFVYILFGGGIATWLMMRAKWLPDPPPPDIRARYLVVLIAGVLGSLAGGYVAVAGSNPMPAYAVLGAASGSLIAAGAVAIFGSARQR